MLPRVLIAAMVLYLTGSLGTAYAQTVTAGDRVRVHFTEYQLVMVGNTARRDSQTVELTGILQGLQTDSLYVEQDGSEDIGPISLTNLARFEVSRGRKNNTLKGMAIGTGIGFGAGFLTGVLMCSGARCEVTGGEAGLVIGVIGAGAGLLLGTVIGAASSGDLWEEVPLSDLQVTLDGYGLTLRIPI